VAKVTRGGSPTIRRRELGTRLRTLRADHGLTAEEVTERLLFSPTKLSRIETGQSGASPRDIRDLCDLYEVTDLVERENLMTLAREGKQRGWWQDHNLPWATYAGLEAEASSIDAYQSGVIPGLIQTEEYARAIFQMAVPPLSPEKLSQLVQVRLTRQSRVAAEDDSRLEYHGILDEAALHRRVGGPQVMGAQLRQLTGAAEQANITVQVIPFDVGAHPAMESDFSILKFDQPLVSDVVYVEGLVGNIILEKAPDIDRYRAVFKRLESMALSESDSITLIRRISDSYA
jgi:transcriptional regulator with XRE-family HTH domain